MIPKMQIFVFCRNGLLHPIGMSFVVGPASIKDMVSPVVAFGNHILSDIVVMFDLTVCCLLYLNHSGQ